jgi:transcriptional regulator with XRE-family HTH domain
MNMTHDFPFDAETGMVPAPIPPMPATAGPPQPLHRIAEARRQQGISARSAARRMRTTMDQVRRQEDPHCDLPLSELYRWQRALQVPVSELLVDCEAPLSEPILTRARLLRVMKTVRAIKESAGTAPIQRFASMLEQQLIELMPELKDVDAWHSVGQRRSPNELGRAADRVLPDSFFTDPLG